MAYKMKTNIANKNNYGSKRSLSKIKYIVIHYTAGDGDTDENNTKYFANNDDIYASAHYFVDNDSITQSVPENYIAWSVGGSRYSNYKQTGGAKLYNKCTNTNSISIEICDAKKDGKIYPLQATIDNAIAFTKELMKKYNIPVENVIRHFDVNGKSCPAYWCGSDAKDKKWKTEFWNKLTEEKKVEKKTEKETSAYYPKYTGNSYGIDTVLKAIGVPEKFLGSWKARKPIAEANGIKDYKGSTEQNTKIINLAKQGKLKKM